MERDGHDGPTRLGSTLRVLRPAPYVLAFYDGRIAGARAWSEAPNWLDDGAYALGACSYAVVDGGQALVFDTHISTEHARVIRRTLEGEGVKSIQVALSHWHADHVAGNAVFEDCDILANALTAEILAERQADLETGTPPIKPLVHPTSIFEGTHGLKVGKVSVELRQSDVHSRDGTVLLIPGANLLLAGDTLEDPVTFVAEPERLEAHLAGLAEMERWEVDRILPNHGSEHVISTGGYDGRLIGATRRYVEKLLRLGREPASAALDLHRFVEADLASGAIHYHEAYEAVHRRNVERVMGRTL